MFVRVSDIPWRAREGTSGRPAQRGYEIHPFEGGRHHLEIWGRLPRNWADRLCRGLARSGIAIVRGFARRDAEAGWIASFDLERSPRAGDPILVDYLALVLRAPAEAPPASLVIDHYTLDIRPDDGSIELEVRGPDQLGFLGGLLERLAFLSLVPEELTVETEPAGSRDRLRLRARDGAAPSPATLRILAEILDGRLCTGAAATG
jgi:hypothetical protein